MFVLDCDVLLRNPGEIFSLATLAGRRRLLRRADRRAGRGVRGTCGSTQAAAAATADVFAPGPRAGPRHRPPGLLRRGLLLGRCECDRPWAVTFTNPGGQPTGGRAAGCAAAPDPALRSRGRVADFRVPLLAHPAGARAGRHHRLYLVLYSTARFLVEFFRVHDQANPFGGPLDTSQFISIGLFALGAWWFLRGRRAPLVPRGSAVSLMAVTSHQRSTRSARSVFQRLGRPAASIAKWHLPRWMFSQRPRAVFASPGIHQLDCGFEAVVARGVRCAQIVQAAEHVVMPLRWERELLEVRVDHHTRPARAEHLVAEQEFVGALARLAGLRRLPPARTLVVQQRFEREDGGVQRTVGRASGALAVPAAVGQLLSKEVIHEFLTAAVCGRETGRDPEDHAGDTRLALAPPGTRN